MNKSNASTGELALRLGLAVTLLYSVYTKLIGVGPEGVAQLFGKAAIIPGSPTLVIAVAVALTVVALMLIAGFKMRIAGMFLSAFFVVTLLTAWQAGSGVWKDIGLLGASLYFALGGANGAHATAQTARQSRSGDEQPTHTDTSNDNDASGDGGDE